MSNGEQPADITPGPVNMQIGVQPVERDGHPFVVLTIRAEFGMVMPHFAPDQAAAVGQMLIDASGTAKSGLILPGARGGILRG